MANNKSIILMKQKLIINKQIQKTNKNYNLNKINNNFMSQRIQLVFKELLKYQLHIYLGNILLNTMSVNFQFNIRVKIVYKS